MVARSDFSVGKSPAQADKATGNPCRKKNRGRTGRLRHNGGRPENTNANDQTDNNHHQVKYREFRLNHDNSNKQHGKRFYYSPTELGPFYPSANGHSLVRKRTAATLHVNQTADYQPQKQFGTVLELHSLSMYSLVTIPEKGNLYCMLVSQNCRYTINYTSL